MCMCILCRLSFIWGLSYRFILIDISSSGKSKWKSGDFHFVWNHVLFDILNLCHKNTKTDTFCPTLTRFSKQELHNYHNETKWFHIIVLAFSGDSLRMKGLPGSHSASQTYTKTYQAGDKLLGTIHQYGILILSLVLFLSIQIKFEFWLDRTFFLDKCIFYIFSCLVQQRSCISIGIILSIEAVCP